MKQNAESAKSVNKSVDWSSVPISMYYPTSPEQADDSEKPADVAVGGVEAKEKENDQSGISHDVGKTAVDSASESVDNDSISATNEHIPDFADIRRRLAEYRRADESWGRSIDNMLKADADKSKADFAEASADVQAVTEDLDNRIAAMSKKIGGLVIPGLEVPKLGDDTEAGSVGKSHDQDKQPEPAKTAEEELARLDKGAKETESDEETVTIHDEREPLPDYDKRMKSAIDLVRSGGFSLQIQPALQASLKETLGKMMANGDIDETEARDLHRRMSTPDEAWADVANPNDLARQTADKIEQQRVADVDKAVAERDTSSAETEKIPTVKPEKVAAVLTDKEKADAIKYTDAIPEVYGDVDGVHDALKSRDRIAKLIRKKGPESDGKWSARDRANYEQWQGDITYFASQFGRRYAEQTKKLGNGVTSADVNRWAAVFTIAFDRSAHAKAEEIAKKSLGGRIKSWLKKHWPHKATDKEAGAPRVEVSVPGRKPNQKQIAKKAIASAETGIQLSSGRTIANDEWADYVKRYQAEKAAEQRVVTFEVVDRPKLHYEADKLPKAKYQLYRSRDKKDAADMCPALSRDQAEIARYFDESAVDNTDQLAIYAAHLLSREQLAELKYDGQINHLAGTLVNNPELRAKSLNMLQDLKDKGLTIDIIQAIGGNWTSYDLLRKHGQSEIIPTDYDMNKFGSERRAASRIYYRDDNGAYHYMVINLANGCVIDPPKGKGIADLHDPLLRTSK